MTEGREERYKEMLMELAARYVNIESNRKSLITVTGLMMRERGAKAVMLVTVLPESEEMHAVKFLKRKSNDFWRFVERESSIERIPKFDFEIDRGEKARQRIDSLLSQ